MHIVYSIIRKAGLVAVSMCALLAMECYAQESTKVINGFSGGMMLHAGYLMGQNSEAPVHPQGLTTGIGGAMHIGLFRHLRLGVEGFSSTQDAQHTDCRDLLAPGSYLRSGYGGFSVSGIWQCKRIFPYVGATCGGGSAHTLMLQDGSQEDWESERIALLNKQGFVYIMPYVGADYALTPSIHLTFRADWQVAFDKGKLLYPTGPRAYVGFMFCH